MTPEQANERLKALDKERDELLKVIEAKPTPEKRFLELIQGLEIRLRPTHPNSVFFLKENKCIVELDVKNKQVWFDDDDFWSVFEKEFGFNFSDIQQLMRNLLEEHFKLVGFTPIGY